MCGIAGHFRRAVPAAVRSRMLAAVRTRGPDAQHIVTFDDAGTLITTPAGGGDASRAAPHGLVHARLSVIDPRPEADQPMASSDGRVYICYNGEVYDWQADARDLEARGARFRTRSDTEYLLHAYDAYGIDGLLARITGMFAFAIVDFRTRTVHLARDRIGKKPLVYAQVDGALAFGSTVRSVLPWLPPARRSFSPRGIDAYLAHRYIPAPLTVFESIARLPNAHRLALDLDSGAIAVHRYWIPQPRRDADGQALLDAAVAHRTVADRPLGLFLSGGIDSATVASRLVSTGHGALTAFSAAFPGSSFDESAEAAATARGLGLANERIEIPTAVGHDFATIVAALDEPFADPSAFPTWYLARATVKAATVVLGGDGGDELFGGYKRVAQHLRTAWRGDVTLPLPVLPTPAAKGWRKVATEFASGWEDAYALRFSGLTPGQRRFLQPDMDALPLHHWREPDQRGGAPAARLLQWDFANYLPEYVLRKADLCTMAHGLELRAPLLDHAFVEAVLGLPDRVRFTDPPKRYLATLAPELDRLGVFARKKRGFNPPVRDWLAGDLAARLPALPKALAAVTQGQVGAAQVQSVLDRYARHAGMAEQVLSLVILEESLRQLAGLAGGQ
ncbi:MAG: asparagine synthase (glutamine-hydrolyzing) [Casimicrobiaceae bacterium]